MTTPKIRPRVFISSVVEGFSDYREAARQAVITAGGEPILVNEDFPALASSSRNACLEAVESADIFLLIIGSRGGWSAPSGKLVVQEEFEHAKLAKLPTLVFIHDTKGDAATERLVKLVSDYIDGRFRKKFNAIDGLQSEIARALAPLVSSWRPNTVQPQQFDQELRQAYEVNSETVLRFVISSERSDELIDPVTLGSKEFIGQVYAVGHATEVGLLSYERAKKYEIGRRSITIVQNESHRHDTMDVVRIEITEKGLITIDANITGRKQRGDMHSFLNSHVIAAEDLEDVLYRCFRFTRAFYDHQDEYLRHQRFYYNCSLSGIGHRRIERNPQERSSYQVPWGDLDEPLTVFDDLRLVARQDLTSPDNEIKRVVEYFTREVNTER